jgi:branched-chain amino acid transport system substrate-binding protein
LPHTHRLLRPLVHALCAALAAAASLCVHAQSGAGDLVIGNVASITNTGAGPNSRNLLLGYQIYFEHVNRNGGVRGRKVRLVNRDDDVKPDAMVEHAKQLIADKEIVALAGFLNTLGLNEIIRQEMLVKSKIAMIAHVGSQDAPHFYPVRAGYTDEVRRILDDMKSSQRKRVALVYVNQAFGPPMFKLAMETAPGVGLDVVATGVFESAPDKLDAGIEAVATRVAAAKPDAVFLMAGGQGAYRFLKRYKEIYRDFVQFYALSPADHFGLIKVAGLESAQGVIISQCVPHPRNSTLAIVREYQKMMKEYAPKEPPSFYGLEGFMGAKIVVEGLRRAGANPTREKVLAALDTMQDFDLGDFTVSYTPARRVGSKLVDLTIIGRNGDLFR